MSDPIYQQASMALVRAVDGTHITYPFLEDGDTNTKVYNMLCTQLATDYDAAQVELDDTMASAASAGVQTLPFPSDSEAYFVGDTGHTSVGGGMISFTRTFANIPKSITRPSGSEFYTFPGIDQTIVATGTYGITAMSPATGSKGVVFTTATAHGFIADSEIHLLLSYTEGNDPFINQLSGEFIVDSVPSDTTFVVDIGKYWKEQVTLDVVDGSAKIKALARDPLSSNVPTQLRYDYILPGVTFGVNSYTDITVPPPFQAINTTTGYPVDTLTQTTTRPTYLYYNTMRREQRHIVIESSLSEWAGNILVMKTKTCKAR